MLQSRVELTIGIFAVVGCLIAGLGWWLYTGVFAAFTQGEEAAQVAGDSAATPTNPAPAGSSTVEPDEDPVLRFAPRIAGMPWTAPAYDDFEVRDYPRAFCIIAGDQSKERISCNCYTQQATPIDIEDRTCIAMARHGYFDPRLPPIEERERQNEASPFSAVAHSQPPAAVPSPAPIGIGRGVDRSLLQPYTPPDFLK